MWGAFLLSRARHEREVRERVSTLKRLNRAWDLHVPIRWSHPAGWRATRRQATRMAESYQVVYATRGGARDSDHYEGRAVDLTCVGLPRTLRLVGPDGAQRTFDLSAPEQTRDLDLTPELIAWVEGLSGSRSTSATTRTGATRGGGPASGPASSAGP
jgi:hypothetical protein